MDIEEIQKQIVTFAKKRTEANSTALNEQTSFTHLIEEIGEIAKQLSNKSIRPEKYDQENLKEEIIDVLLETLILAHLYDVNLNEEISKKIEALYKKHNISE